jgi:hypothetical protein
MKKLSETMKERGIAVDFPIKIKDAKGRPTYYENSEGFWCRWERDAKGRQTYYEDSRDFWRRYERDAKGNETYYEDSEGFWCKWERDANGNKTYYENSDGYKRGAPKSSKTCEGKVIEVDGLKYKLTAL